MYTSILNRSTTLLYSFQWVCYLALGDRHHYCSMSPGWITMTVERLGWAVPVFPPPQLQWISTDTNILSLCIGVAITALPFLVDSKWQQYVLCALWSCTNIFTRASVVLFFKLHSGMLVEKGFIHFYCNVAHWPANEVLLERDAMLIPGGNCHWMSTRKWSSPDQFGPESRATVLGWVTSFPGVVDQERSLFLDNLSMVSAHTTKEQNRVYKRPSLFRTWRSPQNTHVSLWTGPRAGEMSIFL